MIREDIVDKDGNVNVELALDKETAVFFKKQTKKELTVLLVVSTLRNKVQDETVSELERQIDYDAANSKRKTADLEARLVTTKRNLQQAVDMLDTVIGKWST